MFLKMCNENWYKYIKWNLLYDIFALFNKKYAMAIWSVKVYQIFLLIFILRESETEINVSPIPQFENNKR